MPNKKKARPAVGSKRASVQKHKDMISQDEWNQGCKSVALAFFLTLALYLVWMVAIWL